MRRREFIASFAAAASLPLACVVAQQRRMPVVGFLNPASPAAYEGAVRAFEQGLAEGGFTVGRDVRIEYRWAHGQTSRLPDLAMELVRYPVDVLVPNAGMVTTLAAKAATSTIPIVFAVGSDPVKQGLVASFNRPGGNATGLTIMTTDLEAKRVELLSMLAPRGTTIGVIVNPRNPDSVQQIAEVEEAGRKLAASIRIERVSGAAEFAPAFERLAANGVRLLALASDPMFRNQMQAHLSLASRHGMFAIYQYREFVTAGGLLSYGTSIDGVFKLHGHYTARILKGERPADLPVQQPTRFELVLNLKTAKSLGLEFPATLLAIADEVIE